MHRRRLGWFTSIAGSLLSLSLVATGPVASAGPPARRAAPPCGPAFSVVNSPRSPVRGILEDVAAIAPDDVWAVGDVVEHWDGAGWSQVPSPNPFYLFGVAAISSDDVWAVGGDDNFAHTWIQHWDGSAWTRVPSPNPGTQSNLLLDVAAVSSDDVWAVGYSSSASNSVGLIEHWDGVGWTVTGPSTRPVGLVGVVAISSDDVWAVGAQGNETYAEHWDGASWTSVTTPSPGTGPNALEAAVAFSTGDVWAVGFAAGNTRTLVEHWDGDKWSVVASPPGESGLFAVAGASPGDIWATSVQAMNPLVEHYDGTSWSVVSTPIKDGTSQLRQSGVGVLPTGEVWVVGFSTGPFTTLKERLCPTQVLDSGFSAATTQVPRGMTAAWSIPSTDAAGHTVTDGTGMGLFDSGLRAPGTSYTFRFFAAGTYVVIDTEASHTGTIKVPADATPPSGGMGTTFTVAWASTSPHTGYVFDAQILRPGAADWADWQTGVTMVGADFVPDAGPGTYSFRARLRNTANGAASDWSPAVSIEVSGS